MNRLRSTKQVIGAFGLSGLLGISSAFARPADSSGIPLQKEGVATTIGGTNAMAKFVRNLMRGVASLAPEANSPVAEEVDGPISVLSTTTAGVPKYDLKSAPQVPRLRIAREAQIDTGAYRLDSNKQRLLEKTAPQPLATVDLLTSKEMDALTKVKTGTPGTVAQFKNAIFSPKGKVSRADFDRITMNWKNVNLGLKPYRALTENEFKFLSALLLYQKNDGQCSGAIGLFHDLSKTKDFYAEANYYMAHCSMQLGLSTDFFEHAQKVIESQDVYYTKKVFTELGSEVPYEFSISFGEAILKASQNKKLTEFEDKKIVGNVNYVFATAAMQVGKYKEAIAFSKNISINHPKYQRAQFLQALAEYQVGSKETALKIEQDLIAKLSESKNDVEFQALVALNFARMQFQERNFKSAEENFLKVTKDQPLWLQSLTEMGWSQLQAGDFEGAIGNMYSIQSPFFKSVYKPESYVIRTIGYLNLCQYGDAYRTLTSLEKDYRPWLNQIVKYRAGDHDYYNAVKAFIASSKSNQDFDGLPGAVVRELARQKDFLNLQTSLNRQIDEHQIYGKLDDKVSKELAHAQTAVTTSRARIKVLKDQLLSINSNPTLEPNRMQWRGELDREFEALNSEFFLIDLYKGARVSLTSYRKEAVVTSQNRMAALHNRIEKTLETRLAKVKDDLIRMLDNNELLRYEVFAGSGENIRYQVAGGKAEHRVPASVIPQAKSLQWTFEGEYWEDEIGHYRSSLKSNCPDQQKHAQASLGGSK